MLVFRNSCGNYFYRGEPMEVLFVKRAHSLFHDYGEGVVTRQWAETYILKVLKEILV